MPVDRPPRPNLVFTSASRAFALSLVSYEGGPHLNQSQARYLAFVYAGWPEVFARYDSGLVLDDDLDLDGHAIEAAHSIALGDTIKAIIGGP